MTGEIRLAGVVAVSTISLVAILWYLRRKRPPKKPEERRQKISSSDPKATEQKGNLRHISSQPLLAEQNEAHTSEVITKQDSMEKEVVEEFQQQKTSVVNHKLRGDFSPEKTVNKGEHILSGETTLQPTDLDSSKNCNEFSQSKNNSNNRSCSEYQNKTRTIDESVTSAQEMSLLNEALTASRMNDLSFVNKTEAEPAENVEEIITSSNVKGVMTSAKVREVCRKNKSESEEDSEDCLKNKSLSEEDNIEPEVTNEQEALSISTMVPLLESTNLDITCSQTRENDSTNDIKSDTSIQLESSVNDQVSEKNGLEMSHSEVRRSPSKSNRYRNDSSCSNHSSSQMEDRISESSSDLTPSPNKDRNSVSPGKDQHLENGFQSSDNCDTASVESDKGSNGVQKNSKAVLSYRCNFPTELCGRLIGKYGKNINFIKERSGANVALNTNPFTPAFQLCTVEGTQKQIDNALSMIGKKFPEVDLSPVNIPTLNDPQPPLPNPLLMPEIMQLQLPEGVSVDVVVSSIVDAGHIFMQQPTHPSFPSLERLNQYMNACYTQDGVVPQLPRPLEVGVICVAPVMDGWYRAQVTAVDDDNDECDVKFVDYGGFSRLSGSVLRQIRSDFMTLPFQGIECYMANITPLQDEEYFSSEAAVVLEELTQGKLLQAQVVGRNEDGIAYCHIYQISGDKVTFVNRELVNRGVVRWIEILS